MKKITITAFLLVFSLLMPQQAQAATSIKVSAILVKTNDWTTICNGGLFLANIDLSQPRDRMYNCGIKTLVNKKIEGILQLQVLNNQIWEDFEQSKTLNNQVTGFPHQKDTLIRKIDIHLVIQ
jgi:hypothetical protein